MVSKSPSGGCQYNVDLVKLFLIQNLLQKRWKRVILIYPERISGTVLSDAERTGLNMADEKKGKVIAMKDKGELSKVAAELEKCSSLSCHENKELAESYGELAKSYISGSGVDIAEKPYEQDHGHEHKHDHGPDHVHSHSHPHQHTKQVINRLARATGHLDKVKRMVERGDDCTEVLIQLSAVIAALNRAGKVILEDHIENCIVDAVRVGDEKAIEDLKNAIDRFVK